MTRSAPVIGVVGNDLPRQLVLATGAIPHRVTGASEGQISDHAAAQLGAVDVVVHRIFDELRERRRRLDAVVICNDRQAHLRLFYVLRASGWDVPVHLLDMPRTDSAHARRFARAQYRSLVAFCAGITGTPPSAGALVAAAEGERRLGAALARLRARRRSTEAGPSGSRSLDALLASSREAPDEAVAVVEAASSSADPRVGAIRLHLTGSAHPDATIYAELEATGFVVVSEDHDTGDGAWLGAAADGDDVDAVAEALLAQHFDRTVTSSVALAADRAALTAAVAADARAESVVALVRDLDEAPLWDIPDQREQLRARGIRMLVRSHLAPGESIVRIRDLANELTSEPAR